MSVAVLERKVNTEEEDKLHNSQISEQYKKLIDPETTLLELLAKSAPVDYEAEYKAARGRTYERERPVRVENARTDSDIFRADSFVNKKSKTVAAAENMFTEEEDNEDLRPTQATIKYRTADKANGKIETKPKKTTSTGLTKRDKIVIAVACAVIIALFVLIIVNSAIITGLNSDIAALQNNLTQSEATFNELLAEKEAYFEEGNIFNIVSDFANKHGMFLK